MGEDLGRELTFHDQLELGNLRQLLHRFGRICGRAQCCDCAIGIGDLSCGAGHHGVGDLYRPCCLTCDGREQRLYESLVGKLRLQGRGS